jgi:uncharacterized protein (DUF1800 family)
MARSHWTSAMALALMLTGAAAVVGAAATDTETPKRLPWAAAGWTEREAAAHLLDRFAYGPRPGDVDRVVGMGLESWLEAQLGGAVPDAKFEDRVRDLDVWRMPASDIVRTFPPYSVLRRDAMREGLIDRGGVPPAPGDPPGKGPKAEQRAAIVELYRERGYRAERELIGQLMAYKLLQAVYSENQLEAVLIDFWFNHFNVSLTDNQARLHLLSFERDAITPGVLGKFHDLLSAVAAHPAMLLYLDNAQSTANPEATTTIDSRRSEMAGRMGDGGGMRRGRMQQAPANMQRPAQVRRPRGLNENYARELLELHTLGVDGGYTQEDVIAVARAFTGWTVLPPGEFGDRARERMQRGGAGRAGSVEREAPPPQPGMAQGGFFFRAGAHDAEAKTVLGKKLPAGRGIEDGRDVLAMVSRHPSTARHMATKIAARFVADEPPPALVDRLAQTFLATGGDLKQVMRTLAYSGEFWSRAARASKIKSPFEVAVSAARALGAEVTAPRLAPLMDVQRQRRSGSPDLLEWINRMGQPLYAYQAPTGFPDRAEAWVSTGSLLVRMNFGLHLASGRVAGAAVDLAALNGGREPESPEHALAVYAALVLPERDSKSTIDRLAPLVRDPAVSGRVERAAAETPVTGPAASQAMADGDAPIDERLEGDADVEEREVASTRREPASAQSRAAAPVEIGIENVVGLILGSPEFQRR